MTSPGGGRRITQTIVRAPMTGWFDPAQLSRTAIRALLSTLFGAYADQREMQSALQTESLDVEAQDLARHAQKNDLWIDYVADLGDGWDSTYSIAWLLSQPSLRVDGVALPRGELLVMGGDQVYPTATRQTYQDKFVGPYAAALPWVEGDGVDLYALPGNHDWYDGLSSYLKLFCQQRWIGGHKTRQRRSYFALQLPHHWWLWAVDIQLEADIDAPQKRYFEYFANKLDAGDRVILCSPTSSWVDDGDPRASPDASEDSSHPNLTLLEGLIQERKAEVALNLAGDLHHYSHYVQRGGNRQKFTSGGGGAFLRGTHDLPPVLQLDESQGKATYDRVKAYPDDRVSRLLCLKNLAFAYFNPTFSLFIGALYLFYAWIWQSASKDFDSAGSMSLMERLIFFRANLSGFFGGVLPELYRALAHRPGTLLLTMVLPVGFWLFADPPPWRFARLKRAVWGPGHGVAHFVLGVLLLWLFSYVNLVLVANWLCIDPHSWMDDPRQALLFAVEMLTSGFLLGSALTGLYLLLSNALSGLHADEVFSSLHIADYKNFLRIHLEEDAITIYPVGVPRVCRRWKLSPAAVRTPGGRGKRAPIRFTIDERADAPWFAPDSGGVSTRFLEPPVRISTTGERGHAKL
jgi:hypothetical protein